MKNIIELKVQEFCREFNLYNYEKLLNILLIEIYKNGCRITTGNYNREKNPWHMRNSSCQIIIPKPNNFVGLNLIWAIAHELGHHFDPISYDDKSNEILKEKSEIRAWNKANEIILGFSLSEEMYKNFLELKNLYVKYSEEKLLRLEEYN